MAHPGEASEVQISRRNTVNDDLKNIFKGMNNAKLPVSAVSAALKKGDSIR